MVTLWIIIAVAIIAAVIIIYMTTRKNAEETPQVINQPQSHQIVGSSSKLKSIDSGTWYMCTDEIKPYEAGVVYLGADIDPAIKMWERYFREATKEEIEAQHPTPEPEPAPEPTPEPKEEVDYTVFNDVIEKFASVIKIEKDSLTYMTRFIGNTTTPQDARCRCFIAVLISLLFTTIGARIQTRTLHSRRWQAG